MVTGQVQEGTDGINDEKILIPDGFLFGVGDRYLNPSTNIVSVLCSSTYAGTSVVGTGTCTGMMLAYIFWDLGRGGQGHSNLPQASNR